MRKGENAAWERMPRETQRAYTVFCDYRDMGPERSLRKLIALKNQQAEEDAKKQAPAAQGTPPQPITVYHKPTTRLRQLGVWSSRWQWVDRCNQFDDDQRRQEQVAMDKARKDMFARHAKNAVMALNLVQDSLVKRLRAISQSIETGKETDPLDLQEMTRLFDVAVKVERISRGEPAEGHDVSDPLVDLLDQFRQQYARMPASPEDPQPEPPQPEQPPESDKP